MSQPLHATSFAGIRVFRRAVSGGLIGVCAVVAFWSISPARGGRSKATHSIVVNPNPLPPPLLNQKGRLTSMGNGQRRTAYEYDELGRPTRTVHNFESQSEPFTTTYALPQSQVSPTGLGTVPSSQTFPDNEKVDYTYDAGGAEQSIKTTPPSGQQQTIISGIFRNSRGQTIAATYGNGAISIYKYNETTDLRLNQIKTAVGATLTITGGVPQLTGGTTLQDYGYSFDSNGNVIGVADNFNPSLSATYGYDTLDQLIRMTSSGQPDLAYTYDRIGNLTGKEGVTQSYYGGGLGQGPHALASANGVTYSYDNNGNLISTSNGTNITWNSENMPATVVQGGSTMYQKFFVGESLWKKVEPAGTTYYLPSMRIENNQVRKFFGGFAERSPDGSLKFYHGDQLGSASLVTDSAGAMIRRQSYMPYGSDRLIDPNGSFNPKYQFNFKEKESTGFYDYGARLYFPLTGRWLSPDGSTADGLNRYGYVRNNPLRFSDPTGHDGKEDFPKTVETIYNESLDAINALKPGQRVLIGDAGVNNGSMGAAMALRSALINAAHGQFNEIIALPNNRTIADSRKGGGNPLVAYYTAKLIARAQELGLKISTFCHSNGCPTMDSALSTAPTFSASTTKLRIEHSLNVAPNTKTMEALLTMAREGRVSRLDILMNPIDVMQPNQSISQSPDAWREYFKGLNGVKFDVWDRGTPGMFHMYTNYMPEIIRALDRGSEQFIK